jgi:serine/threonine protein phosphatase PrpC
MQMNSRDEFGQEVPEQLASEEATGPWKSMDVDLSAISHPGLVKEANEDSYLVIRFGRTLESVSTNLDESLLEQSYSFTGYGVFVADGMAAMTSGDLSSRKALAHLVDLILNTSDWTLALTQERDVQTVLKRMTQRFLQIDEILREEAKRHPALAGMGTTLTVAGLVGSDLVIGHVGDSRAYLLRGTDLQQLTTDHTLAQALIDAGVANRDDPATRSMRHVLTAAIGSMGEQIHPQIESFKLETGDRILLCSDGLTEMVNDKTITQVLSETTSSRNACQTLVDLALAAGGVDNITVVVALL